MSKAMEEDDPIECDTLTADDLFPVEVDDYPDLRVYRDTGMQWEQRPNPPDWLEKSAARKQKEDEQMNTAIALSKSMVDQKKPASAGSKSGSAVAAASAGPAVDQKKPPTSVASASASAASGSAAAAASPATRKTAAAPPSKLAPVLRKECTLGEPNEWVSDMALARLYATILDVSEYPGIYVKTRWPTPANEMVDMLNRGNADTKAATTQPAVLMYSVNIQCGDLKSYEFRGNHWVAIVVDSRSRAQLAGGGKGLIYYWDPLGNRLKLTDLRDALTKRFKGFVLVDTPIEVQDDGIQCAIWVALYINQFRRTVRDTNNTYALFDLTEYSNDLFYDLTLNRGLQYRSVNQRYIQELRRKWGKRLPDIPSHTDKSSENLTQLMHPD